METALVSPKSVLVNLNANQEYIIVFSLEALINHRNNLSYFSILTFFIVASKNPTRHFSTRITMAVWSNILNYMKTYRGH